MGKETKDLDTYTLYLMTFTAYLLFIWGIAESFLWAIILAPLIFFSGFIWKRFMYEKVRERITRKLKREKAIEIVKCPHCGSEAIIEKTVLEWNKGCKIFKCDKCNKKLEMEEVLNIG